MNKNYAILICVYSTIYELVGDAPAGIIIFKLHRLTTEHTNQTGTIQLEIIKFSIFEKYRGSKLCWSVLLSLLEKLIKNDLNSTINILFHTESGGLAEYKLQQYGFITHNSPDITRQELLYYQNIVDVSKLLEFLKTKVV